MKTIIYLLFILPFVGCNNTEPNKEISNDFIEVNYAESINEDIIKLKTELVSFEYSECLENCDIHSKVYSTKLMNDSLFIEIGVHLNCAGSFTGNFELLDDTLNLMAEILPDENGSVVMASCNCFYKLNYTLSSIDVDLSTILINGKSMNANYRKESYIAEELDSLILND